MHAAVVKEGSYALHPTSNQVLGVISLRLQVWLYLRRKLFTPRVLATIMFMYLDFCWRTMSPTRKLR